VEVEKPVTVVERVEVSVAPKGGAWPALLLGLAKQIDAGRIYDRDLRQLAEALNLVLMALHRRSGWQRLMR